MLLMKSLTKTVTLSANSSWYLYNFRQSTLKELILREYTVVCISPEDGYHLKLIEMGCQHCPINFSSNSKNPLLDLLIIYKLFKIYRKINPCMCFHFTVKNNIYGTLAAKLLNIPAVNNVSGLGTAFLSISWSSIIVRLLYKMSQPFAHKVYCQNSEDFEYLIKYKLVPEQNLSLLPGSGVDLKRFKPSSLDRNPNTLFTFLFAGRMLRDKGVIELVNAMTEINSVDQSCKLILCGFSDSDNISAITKDELQAFSSLPYIDWIGPTDSIEEVLAEVDCVVLPSYREGMPKILLEAGAMGLPSLASDVPGCQNIIQDGVNGLLFQPKQIASLKNAMDQMLKMSDKDIQSMGLNALNIVKENFDEEIVIKEFFKVLDERA